MIAAPRGWATSAASAASAASAHPANIIPRPESHSERAGAPRSSAAWAVRSRSRGTSSGCPQAEQIVRPPACPAVTRTRAPQEHGMESGWSVVTMCRARKAGCRARKAGEAPAGTRERSGAWPGGRVRETGLGKRSGRCQDANARQRFSGRIFLPSGLPGRLENLDSAKKKLALGTPQRHNIASPRNPRRWQKSTVRLASFAQGSGTRGHAPLCKGLSIRPRALFSKGADGCLADRHCTGLAVPLNQTDPASKDALVR